VVVSGAGSAAGSASVATGRWVPTVIEQFGSDYITGAVAINDRGQVLGVAGEDSQMVLWQKGSLRELGLTASGDNYPGGVNERAQVVGGAYTEDETVVAFVWQGGKVRLLRKLSSYDYYGTAASGISDKGQIVGQCERKACIWTAGKAQPLATPRGRFSEAAAINERDTVVGSIGSDDAERAAVWRRGALTVLPSLGGASAATDVNERSQIVGWSLTRDGKYHAVLWEGGKIHRLGPRFTSANAINDAGVIVGACGKSACVWESGRLTNLGKVVSSAFAVDINNSRTIVGNVHDTVGGPCCSSVYLWRFQST
jgi:probable HAF family extracellular repeat protein